MKDCFSAFPLSISFSQEFGYIHLEGSRESGWNMSRGTESNSNFFVVFYDRRANSPYYKKADTRVLAVGKAH